jgi:hypothetical protein
VPGLVRQARSARVDASHRGKNRPAERRNSAESAA